MLCPIRFCDELGVQERLTECCGGGVPVPVQNSTVGEFEALLVNETLPDAAPVADRVNVTVNCTCWPAGIVKGKDGNPLTPNAEPVTISEVTVTLRPLALRLTCCCAFVPTATLPKFMLVGATDSCP